MQSRTQGTNGLSAVHSSTANVETSPDTRTGVPVADEPRTLVETQPGSGRQLLFVTLTLVALVGGGAWLRGQTAPHPGGGASSAQSKADIPRLMVTSVPVRRVTVQDESLLSGQVEPYHVAVLAAEYPNRVVARRVQQGDHVAAGMVLINLDDQAAEIAVQQARGAMDQARAARKQAETDYLRSEVETDAGRQQARAQVDQAKADERKARAQVEEAEATRRKTAALSRAQEIRQAEAALAQVRTDEHLAQLEVKRYAYLVRQGATAQQVLDRAQATLDAAVARRQSAEQGLSLATEGARQEDRDAVQAQLNASRAQVDAATQQVDVARATLRVSETRDTRLAVLRHQIDGLRAQEAQAADAVRQAEVALAKRTSCAPFAGRVLATYVEAGDLASVGTPLLRLGQIDRVKVTVSVPEASRPSLKLGQVLTVTADALTGRSFRGYISALGFQADARSRAFPLEITVENPQESLLPNMIARVRLPLRRSRGGLTVPTSAIATDGKQTYVFAVDGDRAVRRNIELGTSIGEAVEVRAGLREGERIATTPQRLSDGARVAEIAMQGVRR